MDFLVTSFVDGAQEIVPSYLVAPLHALVVAHSLKKVCEHFYVVFTKRFLSFLVAFFKDAAKQTSTNFTFQENFLRFFEQFRSHFWKTWSIFKAPALFRGTGKFFSVVKFE